MDEYQIEFLRTARKELSRLPPNIQKRIRAKLEQLKTNPYLPGVKFLKNGGGRLRLRVGEYRIIYRVETESLIIIVIRVGHRRSIYR